MPAGPSGPTSAARPPCETARILVADDDPDIRALIELTMARAGHHVVASVADGTAALDAARAHRPDLAVLDVSMPGLTGLQVCAELRAEPPAHRPRVLLVSADAGDAAVRAGLAAGADGYLSKPFALRTLREQVAALLAQDTP